MSDLLYVSNSFAYNYSIQEADVIFLGIPFSSTSISCSSIFGPVLTRESLKLAEGYEEVPGRDVFKSLKVCDIGDLDVVPGDYSLTAERINETIKEIREVNKKAFLVFIGGEHLITLPIAEALKPKTIVQLDAHMDLRKDYLGNDFSHTTWAYHAKKKLNCDLVQIGARSFCEQEKKTAEEFGVVNDIKNPKEPIYLTVDMDVFDPRYVKTGLPVYNGLSPERVFEIIEKLKGKKLIGMDIVEIADNSLPSNTGFLAAEIIRKVFGVMV